MSEGKIIVAGLGNVLMGDDAAGPYIIELLKARYEFPEYVEVEDLGTPGLDLTPHITGYRAIIFIDTVRSDGEPGELRLYTKDQILQYTPPVRVSPHDPGIKEALFLADMSGTGADYVSMVGILPKSCGMHDPLSEQVERGLEGAIASVVDELTRLGAAPTKRAVPLEPNLWWKKS
jgi:hydrogenase maturation protease